MVSKNSFKHITLLLILVFSFWIISVLGSRVLMANPGNGINEIVTAKIKGWTLMEYWING